MSLSTIFFGTPEFAVPTVAAMLAAGFGPKLVVSQPARPTGRGRRRLQPPVAEWAEQHGIALRQPESVRDESFLDELRALAPQVAVVVAYGQIFRRPLLELPARGCINLHASLLPRWRGAAPIQAALIAGDRETGVTTMQMDVGLDTGPILLQRRLAIGESETAPELAARLATAGGELMVETLRCLEQDRLTPWPQDAAAATLAPRLTKADGLVDWRQAAERIHDRWRGLVPWPGLTSELAGQPLKILSVHPVRPVAPADSVEAAFPAPGTILEVAGDALRVACGNGTILALEVVQRPGKRPITGRELLHGEHLELGILAFTPPSEPASNANAARSPVSGAAQGR